MKIIYYKYKDFSSLSNILNSKNLGICLRCEKFNCEGYVLFRQHSIGMIYQLQSIP